MSFAAPGRAVALVNFHGSTGFGEAFTTSIHGAWGEHPTADVLAVTDHLIERGVADPDRMAVTGGSYGGYLTCWITATTDRFTCAVAHAAVTDLPAMYASDWTTDTGLAFGAQPWEDLERVNRWSPFAQAAKIQTPTLVVHGELDLRVPVTQGLAWYGMLKARGVEARLVHYPDENHWILKPRNSLHWYGEVLGMAGPVPRSGGRRKTEDGRRTLRSCRLWLEQWFIGVHCQAIAVTIQHPPLHVAEDWIAFTQSGSWLYLGYRPR